VKRAQLYDWLGNVRELQSVVERAVIVSRGGKLTFDLPSPAGGKWEIPAPPPAHYASQAVIPEQDWRNRERANVLAALREANFKVSGKGGAAELLGISPGTLESRIKVFGMTRRARLGITPHCEV
jgi:transcriptional regulator with GAF, ATPase, and Fis domain